MVYYEDYARYRDKKGYNDSKVAAITGIPNSTFSDWKRGKSIPKIEKLIKIADALEIPINAFVDISEMCRTIPPITTKALEIDPSSPQYALFNKIKTLDESQIKMVNDYVDLILNQK